MSIIESSGAVTDDTTGKWFQDRRVNRIRRVAAVALVAGCAAGLRANTSPAVAQEHREVPPAVIEGVVLVEGTSRPLPTAIVELVGQGRETIADDEGRFRLTSVLPGTDTLVIRLLEFESDRIPLTIAPGGTHRLELVVAYPSATLEELVVEVARTRSERMRGFEHRRRRGIGSFITREEIERRNPPYLSWLFWGLKRVRVRGGQVLLDARGVNLTLRPSLSIEGEPITIMRDTGECTPAIFVDGVKRGPLTHVDDVFPEEVAGIEVYTSPFIPARFSDAFNRCGSIVIWRRSGRGPS